MKAVRSINIHVFALGPAEKDSEFGLAVEVNAVPQKHERCLRTYPSAGDAITSARHLVNEVSKTKS